MAPRMSDDISGGWWFNIPPEERDAAYRKIQDSIHPASDFHKNNPFGNSNLPVPINYGPNFTGRRKRRVVAFDCEMVGVAPNKRSHICELCVVDVLTGEVLIDCVIDPKQNIIDWRTESSNMTATKMRYHRRYASRDGQYLEGFEAAREAFFNFVDQNTILVTHAGDNDLKALGLVHNRIINTQILTKKKVSEIYGRNVNPYSLKQITYELIGRWIQGFDGHECLEDTLATRDTCLRILKRPQDLEAWAEWQVRLLTGEEKRVVRLLFGEEEIIEKPYKQRELWGQPTARERIDKIYRDKEKKEE
ncbi:ribonuclease H-like domain-containing protein [Aspergillus keveii]|uniref:Ribonuclease H-like domain-containing protein n=1 Tax=Aspergillus keveii TaxID=714993 RepID=A0ABR4GHR9_9EURO